MRNQRNQLQKNQEYNLLIIEPGCVSELPMSLLKIEIIASVPEQATKVQKSELCPGEGSASVCWDGMVRHTG